MSENDLYWLAGLLEGEGSFLAPAPSAPNKPRISVSMTDEEIVAKAAALINVSYAKVSVGRSERNGWSIVYRAEARGKRAVNLMCILKPLMGKRRQHQIEKAVMNYAPQIFKLNEEQIKNVRQRLHSGESGANIARSLGVTRELISSLKNNKLKYALDL